MRTDSIRSGGIVGQRVSVEHGTNGIGDRDGQRVVDASVVPVGEADDDNAIALIGGGNGEDLRRAQDLAEPLILANKVCAPASVINMRKHQRAADGAPEFVSDEGWNT